MESVTDEDRPELRFGSLHVVPARRELRVDGRLVEIGGRAFEIVSMLIAAQGAPVTKDDIARAIWPGAIAEENTIEAHISALRKALGKHRGMIRTMWGRGYRLIADAAAPVSATPAPVQGNLPTPVTELIGRDGVVARISDLLTEHRLVTLTGIGGIGKTRLALEVARRQAPQFADGAWLAEFAALSDPNLVPDTVAAALGLELGGGGTREQRLARAVTERSLLLMLDNCEHVLDAVTRLAETMLQGASRLRILVTSREALR
jgi:DNA-binding winged helix-turn-helix (wHTH) protein